jgi:iron complex transport system ATP-binding protein
MLSISSLSAGYGSQPILQNVSLEVPSGEILAVVGPNGAGKSTLIRAISGVLSPSQGRILAQGQDLTRLDPTSRAHFVAVVPQAQHLPEDFSVTQTVLLGRTPYLGWLGQVSPADRARVEQALVTTQLETLSERLVGQLSGGEQQRVLLARALVQDTAVLLLDEPTAHLDLEHQSRILSLIRGLAAETGKSVLMVVHDLNLAALYADRVLILQAGQVYASGTPQQVLTEANLSAVYHTPVRVIPHPEYGTPLILPDGVHLA